MRKISTLLFVLTLLLAACNLPVAPTPGDATAPPTETSASQPPAATTPSPVTRTPAATISATAALATAAPSQSPAEPVIILRVEMLDEQNGWAVGETAPQALQRVLFTSDGGLTWQDATPTELIAEPGPATAVLTAFSGLKNAWAIWFTPVPAPASEALIVWHTADRGDTWTPGQPLDTADLNMDFFIPGELGFSGSQDGWLLAHLGAGMNHDYVALYRTADAGQTWIPVVEPGNADTQGALPMSCAKTGVAFSSPQTGWVSGNCYGVQAGVFLYRSDDGGQTWALAGLPPPEDRPRLMTNEEHACGSELPVFTSASEGVVSVVCQLSDGSSQRWLYHTSDGGQTWTPETAPLTYGSLDFTASGRYWMLGSAARNGQGAYALFASPDAGQTWNEVSAKIDWDGQISFVDAQNGWAAAQAGEQTRLLRTSDGGVTWSELTPRAHLR